MIYFSQTPFPGSPKRPVSKMNIYISATVSAFFASLVSIFIALAIETFGGNIGGILGAAPSIVVPATIALYLNSLEAYGTSGNLTQAAIVNFQKSSLALCPAVVLDAFFLYSWKLFPALFNTNLQGLLQRMDQALKPGYGLLILVSIISFGLWFFFAIILTLLSLLVPSSVETAVTNQTLSTFYIVSDPQQQILFYFCMVCFVVHAGVAFYLTWTSRVGPKADLEKRNGWIHVTRGAISGIAVFVAVLLGSLSPVMGGLMSLFPAVFGTTMISVWINSGSAVSLGAVEPLILGSVSVAVYAICLAFLLPGLAISLSSTMPQGAIITIATIISYLVAIFGYSVPSYYYVRWRLAVRDTTRSETNIVLLVQRDV